MNPMIGDLTMTDSPADLQAHAVTVYVAIDIDDATTAYEVKAAVSGDPYPTAMSILHDFKDQADRWIDGQRADSREG